MNKLITLLTIVTLGVSLVKSPLTFDQMTIEQRAEAVGLSVEEFELFSGVVEAESNRCQDDTEGRRYIALCILCRVMDSRFPDTIEGVLTQSGQFSTVRNGHSVTSRTDLSDRAVIEAVEWINSGEEYPWLLFFNCRNYFGGYEAYGCYGGNFFSVAEPMLPDKFG